MIPIRRSLFAVAMLASTGGLLVAQDRPAAANPAPSRVIRPGASEDDLARVLAEQERNQTLRMAKIRRLRQLAQQQGKADELQRIDVLERRQQSLYQQRIQNLRQSMGEDAFQARRTALQDQLKARAGRAAGDAGDAAGVVDPRRQNADGSGRPVPRVNATPARTVERPNMNVRTGPTVGTPTRPNATPPARPNMTPPTRPNATPPARPNAGNDGR